MGFSSQFHQNQLIEEELVQQLQIIQEDIIDERAKGIVRQIKGKGINSLSKKQQYIYNKYVEPLLVSRFRECVRCSQIIDVEDAFEINEHEDYMCDYCEDSYMGAD